MKEKEESEEGIEKQVEDLHRMLRLYSILQEMKNIIAKIGDRELEEKMTVATQLTMHLMKEVDEIERYCIEKLPERYNPKVYESFGTMLGTEYGELLKAHLPPEEK